MATTVTSTQTTTNTNTTAQQVDNKKSVIQMNMNFTSTFNDTHNTNVSKQPKEAFVTFSNNQPSYLALLNVLLDSVHAFSTRPIIAFGIDVDLNIDETKYPRVIKRRIAQSDCGPVS
ncbi:unnamed protein product [Rotaria socialis]